jgi:hypothetical protein
MFTIVKVQTLYLFHWNTNDFLNNRSQQCYKLFCATEKYITFLTLFVFKNCHSYSGNKKQVYLIGNYFRHIKHFNVVSGAPKSGYILQYI